MVNYDIDYLIRQIERTAKSFASYKRIATTANIRIETLWRIRTKHVMPNIQTAKKIAEAIEILCNESKNKKTQKTAK